MKTFTAKIWDTADHESAARTMTITAEDQAAAARQFAESLSGQGAIGECAAEEEPAHNVLSAGNQPD